ncbi:hypothetical protein G6F61_014188 [Rhizopus arrhizus]|nr:hypothetical protein G6F61_014188 [Rhizopus arrhizus]
MAASSAPTTPGATSIRRQRCTPAADGHARIPAIGLRRSGRLRRCTTEDRQRRDRERRAEGRGRAYRRPCPDTARHALQPRQAACDGRRRALEGPSHQRPLAAAGRHGCAPAAG